jgi:hypothetical protein
MNVKNDLVTREEIDKCLSHLSPGSDKLAPEQFLKLVQEIQITIEEPKVEDSIDGTRIRFTYTTAISRKRGGIDNDVIRFQYIKEIPVDYSKVPLRLREDNTTTAAAPDRAVAEATPKNDNAILKDTTIIESYDELEKEGVPKLYEVLGLLKRIYFTPEDFSNRLAVDRIHKLRNMFSKDEILTFPSVDPGDKAGLTPI